MVSPGFAPFPNSTAAGLNCMLLVTSYFVQWMYREQALG